MFFAFSNGTIANVYAQNLSLSGKNVPLETIFKEVKKQTGYTFVYTEDMLRKSKPVTIDISNASLQQALDICFKDQPLEYNILNKMVIVKEKAKLAQLVAMSSPPPVNITGKITNQNGEPLSGASISEKGTKNAVVTKDDGTFEMHVSKENATIIITYVGYISKEVNISGETSFNISLLQGSNNMGDVVVVGYGTAKRKDLTGSVASVNSAKIKDLAVTRLDQALIGKIAGVQVKPVSGEPGSPPQVRIRGVGSISAGSTPLYVVDGFPMTSIETINPNDIESIDVLKDASATAIYGSRGSNGVIIVNTKRGKSGK
ncbi:MAG TPA: TonB-dependent receptor plug domain-containing protein, partial [Flavitalea sp.]|nr:TonB-dependent receptor plug domain-containing protein [Flavitalea sp.]